MWVLGLCIRVKWPHGLGHATSGDISNTEHIILNSNKAWPVTYLFVADVNWSVNLFVYIQL